MTETDSLGQSIEVSWPLGSTPPLARLVPSAYLERFSGSATALALDGGHNRRT